MNVVTDAAPLRRDGALVLTPHAGEMAHLLGIGKDAVRDAAADLAAQAAARWRAVVTLKGATTWIASPDGRRWQHDRGGPAWAPRARATCWPA